MNKIGNKYSTDARGSATIFEYDSQNRLVKTTDPLGKFETFSYDGNGNLLATTDRKAQTINFAYDVVNQLIQKTLPGNLVTTFVYDTVGNLTSTIDPDSALGFTYDGAGRLISATDNHTLSPNPLTLTYTYDKNGNRLTMNDPVSGTTSYTYDALNRLSILDPPSSSPINFSYDALSRRISSTLPNGVTTNYTYDAASQLTSLVHQLGIITLSSFGYTYDNVGNRVTSSVQRSAVSVNNNLNYLYDSLYRLVQAAHPLPASPAETFSYDNLGNRLLRDGQSIPAAFDAANRLLSAENFTYGYDNNGNFIQKLETATGTATDYLYDAENQLIEIKTNGVTTATYSYDGLGRRIQKDVGGSITRYIYDNEDILLEYDGASTLLARYTHGAGIDEPLVMERGGQNYFYHVDGLGSITELTDSTGTAVQSYVYDSFGNIVTQNGSLVNPHTYTGREFDEESGLFYFRARYYDPATGRFIREDLLRPLGGLNYYEFVDNNPINLRDPWGLFVFGRRPLGSTPWLKPGEQRNSFLGRINHETFHEHGLFEDGSGENVGYNGTEGIFNEDPSGLGYVYDSRHYDDNIMREALNRIRDDPEWQPNKYKLCGPKHHNCQDFAEELRKEYERIIQEKANANELCTE